MNKTSLKNEAKIITKDNLSNVVLMYVILYAIHFVSGLILGLILLVLGIYTDNAVDVLSILISAVISSLLGFGIESFYLKCARGENVTYKELWNKIDYALKYISIYLLVYFSVLGGLLLFIIPGIVISLSYSMVYFVYLDNPKLTALQTLKRSKEIMKGHRLEYLGLIFSFFGWILLGIFTLGLLYIWLIPYMEITLALYYDKLVGDNNQNIIEVIDSSKNKKEDELFKIF